MQSFVARGAHVPQLSFLAGSSDKYGANKSFKDGKVFLNSAESLSPRLRSLPARVTVNSRQSRKTLVSTRNETSTEDDLERNIPDELKGLNFEQGPPLVKVKFVLPKKCKFGQQFCVVGDDPQFGTWEPKVAIPLEWSEGDVWTTEVDVPVGKQIEYKFILKGKLGEISWQPGQNQVFETSESVPSMVVSSPWEKEEEGTCEDEKKVNEILDSKLEDISVNATSGQGAVPIETVDTSSDTQNGAFGVSVKITEDKASEEPSTIGCSGMPDVEGPSNGNHEERGLFDSATI
uniref:TSA: Wollemia nobilis Ref_Wollemi_Transcript_3976_1719 transcribed RNA sequence n=1 Tax=Wollemia nobilis TaxID=56998 RepID=A0A0C9QWK9_9CONI